jgi:hypothetical protein
MSRYIVLREKGSQETLLIDKATLSVMRLDEETAKALDEGRTDGDRAHSFAGLDFAFSVDYRSKAPARMLYREELPLAG